MEAEAKIEKERKKFIEKESALRPKLSPLLLNLKVDQEMIETKQREKEKAIELYLSKDPNFEDEITKLSYEFVEVGEKINKLIGSETQSGKLLDIYCKLKDIPLQQQYNELGYAYSFKDLADIIFENCNKLYTSVDNIIKIFEGIQAKAETEQEIVKAEDIEQQKAKFVKEPSKEAAQAYKLYYGSGKSQIEVAETMTKKLRKPVSQGQVSKWINGYKKWAEANNIPIPEKPTIINVNSDKLDMGKRTNGKRTGDPHHKAKFDPDGGAYE